MPDLHNKRIFADNLQYYLNQSGKTRKDICETLNLKQSTVGDWFTAKKFPRIDKIEMLANYFRITKAELIEPRINKTPHTITVNNTGDNNNITGGIIDSKLKYSEPKPERPCTDNIDDTIRQMVKESAVDIDIDSILNNRLSDEALSLAKAYDKIQDRNAQKLLWDIIQKILDKQTS